MRCGECFVGVKFARQRGRILGQLMHVDDMDQRAQSVQFLEDALPLDPFLGAHEGQQAEAGEDARC